MRCSALRFTPLRFDDPKLVFSSRSTAELLRAALVFRVAGIPWVVRNARRLVRGSYAVLGTTVTEAVLRATFFSHFCGGTDLESVTPTVHKLERLGIGSILDYAAEKDVDSGGKKKEEGEVAGMSKEERSAGVMSARTFSYEGEESCEENKHIFLQCIDHVCAASPNAFAAIKLTAIGRPELLRRISEILAHVKAIYFAHASGKIGSGDRSDETSPVRMSKEELEACLKGLGIDEAKKIIDSQMWHALDMDGDGFVSFEEWTSFLHPSNPGAQIIFSNFENSKNLKNSNNLKFLNAGELAELNGLVNRLEEIASYAATKKVRLMIDAEQSYFQDAIDLLVKDLQRRYNVKFPAIYNTYQCYLRSSFFRAESDMKLAKEQGWIFAAKIVRGAYMVQERALAEEQGKPSPIWGSLAETAASYDRVASLILGHLDKCAVMFATHNEDTVKKIIAAIEEKKMDSSRVAFGQLLGMCDHVSLTLGEKKYLVFKYVPYGPIAEVVPYLIRRAEENSTLMGSPGVLRERQMIFAELRNRILPAWMNRTKKD